MIKSLNVPLFVRFCHAHSKKYSTLLVYCLWNDVISKGVGDYDITNQEMCIRLLTINILQVGKYFLAVVSNGKIKGVGIVLLSAFEAGKQGKLLCLYTDQTLVLAKCIRAEVLRVQRNCRLYWI